MAAAGEGDVPHLGLQLPVLRKTLGPGGAPARHAEGRWVEPESRPRWRAGAIARVAHDLPARPREPAVVRLHGVCRP